MKKIVVGIVTVLGLTLIQSPAHAEVCASGTYNVAGINTFSQLPCSDPGTEINVTVRGLHDYGMPNGPTAYCSFNYLRRNLGTNTKPNWSTSTDTVCDPKPTTSIPATLTIETKPETSIQTSTIQTSSNQTTECSAVNPCMNYAVVNSSNSVVNVIVCQPSFCSGMVDSNGNRYIPQQAANPDTNDYHGTNAEFSIPEENKIVTVSNDNIYTVTQNGVITKAFVAPDIKIIKNLDSTVFTVNSLSTFFGKNEILITDTETVVLNNLNYVEINATQTINTAETILGSTINNTNTVKESIIFEETKTAQEISNELIRQNLSLLQSKINKLLILLEKWIKN
jgi:hypothetical protein